MRNSLAPTNLQKSLTYTKLRSSPFSNNSLSTGSDPSIWPPNVKITASFCSSLKHPWTNPWTFESQNTKLGRAEFSLCLMSLLPEATSIPKIVQPKYNEPNTIDDKLSELLARKAKISFFLWPRARRFCAARIERERISSYRKRIPLSSLICLKRAKSHGKFNELHENFGNIPIARMKWPSLPDPIGCRAILARIISPDRAMRSDWTPAECQRRSKAFVCRRNLIETWLFAKSHWWPNNQCTTILSMLSIFIRTCCTECCTRWTQLYWLYIYVLWSYYSYIGR